MEKPRQIVLLVKLVMMVLFKMKQVRSAAILSYLLLCFLRASCQEYSVAQWRHKDGLPSGSIYSLAQTPDGFLWLGTADGLVRYDGFQFIPFSMDQFGLPLLGQIRSMIVTADGSLVVGAESGALLRLKNGHVALQSLGSPVVSLSGPFDKSFLVETVEGRFTCVEEGGAEKKNPFVCVSSMYLNMESGSTARPDSVGPEKNGELSGKAKEQVREILREGSFTGKISKVLEASDHAAWIATTTNGLFLAVDGKPLRQFTAATGLSDNRVWDLLRDRDGNVWAGTQNGLNRLQAAALVVRNGKDDLQGKDTNDLAATHDDGLWVGSSSGLRFQLGDRKAVLIGRQDVLAVQSDSRFNLAVLINDAVQRISAAGVHTSFPLAPGRTSLMALSSEGVLWLYGAESGLRTMDTSGKFGQAINLPLRGAQKVTRMAAAPGRAIWIAFSDGTLMLQKDTKEYLVVSEQRNPTEKITYLSPQPDGTLWFTTDAGLRFFDGHRILHWDKNSGLPGNRILWALPDRLGRIWIAYNFGLAEISISELSRQADGKIAQVHYEFYDAAEGLVSNPERHGQTPAVLMEDGKLWMLVSGGLGMIDTSHLGPTLLPPLTHILTITADGLDISLDRDLQLRPLTRTISFTYTGVSLSAPLKVRYRYRLNAFDEQWQNVATRRSATYTNLRPGRYRFQVEASNGDSWNEPGASLDFEVLPTYYQTLQFRMLCTVAVILLLVTFYHLRLKRKEKLLRVRYEDRLAERNRIAQDLHDHLIQEMVGVSLQLEIADETMPEGFAAKKSVQRALDLAQQAVGHGRSGLGTLRRQCLTFAELRQILEHMVKASEASSPVLLMFFVSGLERVFTPEAGEEILQIVREGLHNAMNHSGSDEVSIRVEFSAAQCCIKLADRGRGIVGAELQERREGHFGIRGMQERARRLGASLDLRTGPTLGTEWRLTIPAEHAYQNAESSSTTRLTEWLRLGRKRWKGEHD